MARSLSAAIARGVSGRTVLFTVRQIAIAAALAFAAITGFGWGWWQDDGPKSLAASRKDPEWVDYKPTIEDLAADAKVLAEKEPFGPPTAAPVAAAPGAPNSIGAASVAAAAVRWRVVAIVTSATSRYLVVLSQRPGEAVERSEIRQEGDSLPDGGIVRTIGEDTFSVEEQGKIRTIEMFAQK